jgi:hypothetical protein
MKLSWYLIFNWLSQVKKIDPAFLPSNVEGLIKTYPLEILELQDFLLSKEKIA